MKIVVVTGVDRHHRHLCAAIHDSGHDLVGIIHPLRPAPHRLRKLRRRVRNRGVAHTAMTVAGAGPAWLTGWDRDAAFTAEGARRFPDADRAYARIPESIRFDDIDVADDRSSTGLLRSLDADVVIVLGGPVYPPAFVESAPLMLNFHSGISPIYNGTATIEFAFANGHPHLCGGTLMTMSPVVDGGAILGHVLPAIDAGDTPASLFMKTTRGASEIYLRFLQHLADHPTYTSAAQGSPLFYSTSADWTIEESLRTARNVRRDVAAVHTRPAEIVEYWNEPDDDRASAKLDSTIARLLWVTP